MPKQETFPLLYDEVRQLTIFSLRKKGAFDISKNNNHACDISMSIDYEYKGVSRSYKIDLVAIKSNLGFGKVWYFLCPITNLKCRTLYFVGGKWGHRTAFKGGMYRCQTQSKLYRGMKVLYDADFGLDELYSELYKKNSKRVYAGKPTKRALKIIKQIHAIERFNGYELELFEDILLHM